MAIAFDSTGTNGAPVDAASVTVSLTNTAGTFMMIPVTANTATVNVSTVTWAGTAATQIASSIIVDATTIHHAEWWKLASPATGTNNLVVTMASSTFKINSGILCYTGVSGTGAVLTGNHANVVGSSFSDSITTTATNSWIVSTIAFGQHSGTVADTMTSPGNTRYAVAASQGGGAGDYSTGGAAGAYSVGWQSTVSYNGVADFVQSLVELVPSGGAPVVNSNFLAFM